MFSQLFQERICFAIGNVPAVYSARLQNAIIKISVRTGAREHFWRPIIQKGDRYLNSNIFITFSPFILFFFGHTKEKVLKSCVPVG